MLRRYRPVDPSSMVDPTLRGAAAVAAAKTRIGFDKFADRLKVRYAESYLHLPPARLSAEAALPGGTACRKNPT